MIRSMTGYGRGEAAFEERCVVAEVRAVNNRYLDCAVKMPRAYIFAEDAIRAKIQSSVGRGKVDVFITVTGTGAGGETVSVNEPLAMAYIAALDRLHELGKGSVKGKYSSAELARFPDVLTVARREGDQEEMSGQLLSAVELALEDFNAMRAKEGRKLAEDILGRAEAIEGLVGLVEERSPKTVNEYLAKLEAKMAEVLQNTQIDEARLLTEAAIFADKIAVDEETVRLRSHISQLRELLEKGGAVGRKLDFLMQEFNREANTIGSKCSDLEIARHVVDIKAEIEKMREQVQNLE